MNYRRPDGTIREAISTAPGTLLRSYTAASIKPGTVGTSAEPTREPAKVTCRHGRYSRVARRSADRPKARPYGRPWADCAPLYLPKVPTCADRHCKVPTWCRPALDSADKIRPQLYLEANCPLCSSTDETIEHLFHCPFFIDARQTALTSSIELLKSQQITTTAQELHDALHSHIFHPLFGERSFSASQLPTSFRRWLEPHCSSPA
jgi:hypothetical protein